YVANGKGLASRESFPARTRDPRTANSRLPYDYTARIFEGNISVIPRPDNAQMVTYTTQVRKNSPFTPENFARAPIASDSVIPAKLGEPCPIKYVLYIIKENRTYDQVLGDLTDKTG